MPFLHRLPALPVSLRASLLALSLGLASLPSIAEDPRFIEERLGITPHPTYEEKEWQEAEAPPPPTFDLRRLVPLEMPHYMTLRFGVDPQTMQVTGDGVVRYVVVAHRENGEAVNAFYEGVRCSTDEYKTYARYSGGQWDVVLKAEWKAIDDRNSIYTHQLAKQSLCRGRAPRSTVGDMIRELKKPEVLTY